MRVLHLVGRFSARGGAGRHLLGILDWLLRMGHEVHVAAGVADVEAPPFPLTLVPGLEARGRTPLDLEGLFSSLAPDVVHVHTVMNPEALLWARTRPSLVTVQDHRYFCPGRGKWTAQNDVCRVAMAEEACRACFDEESYFDSILRLTLARRAALEGLDLVVLSRYMARELAAAGIDRGRIHVIPPFVHDLPPSAPGEGEPCVAFVGRLARAKGVWDAVFAHERSGVGVPLVFAGTGPERFALEKAGFPVLGWLDRARLASLYKRAAAVLLPSRWQEPFGIVGIEALSLGTPVVAYESGGVLEWHPGPGLVAWGDREGLALALRDALLSPRPRPREPFAPEVLMECLVSVYKIVSSRTRRAALR